MDLSQVLDILLLLIFAKIQDLAKSLNISLRDVLSTVVDVVSTADLLPYSENDSFHFKPFQFSCCFKHIRYIYHLDYRPSVSAFSHKKSVTLPSKGDLNFVPYL